MFSTNRWLFIGLKTEPYLVHDQVRRGVGLFLIWHHELIYMPLSLCKHACKIVCDIKSGIDPCPFWLHRVPNDVYFRKYWKPTKRQDLAKMVKNRQMRFKQMQRCIVVKKYFGVRLAIIIELPDITCQTTRCSVQRLTSNETPDPLEFPITIR